MRAGKLSSTRRLFLYAVLLTGSATWLIPTLEAGPVPGVETYTKKPVEFPTPPSVEVWDIGEEDYLVTFRWTPGFAVENPGVAGTFTSWNRSELPMEGPDEEGTYTVSVLIPPGEHMYKFIAGHDGWYADDANPYREQGGSGNSILRLGASAFLHEAEAVLGDGTIETRAFEHVPGDTLYFDLFNENEAIIRFRTLRGDVEAARIAFVGGSPKAGTTTEDTMTHAASDSIFDFWEYHFDRRLWTALPGSYTFSAQDADTSESFDPEKPLDWDTSRIVDTPEWARDAVWYQIMVDRFRDGTPMNNPEFLPEAARRPVDRTHPWRSSWYDVMFWEEEDGKTFWRWSMYDRLYGGDFDGLIEKLDYLKGLGVTAIYLNPVFEAHNSHKYNARTYVHADDGYGYPGEFQKTMGDVESQLQDSWPFNKSDQKFLELIEEVHKRNMKIIIDGVFNHVGDDHPAFLDVKENGQDSPYADWFHIISWDPFEYSGWGGFGGLPEFRKTETGLYSESLKRHIFNVTSRWMDPNGDGDPSDGIDGWRLDVPMHIPKPFWQEWHDHVKSINPEAYITGEIWDPAEEWLDGTAFDAVMNYMVPKHAFPWFSNTNRKITVSEFDQRLARLRIRYPRNHTYVLMNLFDSHDTDRWVSRIANPDLDYDEGNRLQDNGPNYMDEKPGAVHYKRLRLMAVFQATYVGAPYLWYGTEVGMFGADDPMCRMPMWWDDMMPYRDADYTIDKDLREHFRTLFSIRHDSKVLRAGDFATAIVEDEKDVYGYFRYHPSADDSMLIVLNNSETAQTVTVQSPGSPIAPNALGKTTVVFGEPEMAFGAGNETIEITVGPISGAILRIAR